MLPAPHLRTRGGRRLTRALVFATAAALVGTMSLATSTTASAILPGQTKTISGVVRNHDGTPASGKTVSFDNVTCDATHTDLTGPDDTAGTTTGADGSFSFDAFASQCYEVSVGEFFYQGSLRSEITVPAGTTGLTLTLPGAIDVHLTLPGVPTGTQVVLAAPMDYSGVSLWYPVDIGTTAAGGSVTLTALPGAIHTVMISRSGDYYTQYLGGRTVEPSRSGGAGTFTAPATGTSFNLTGTVKKSSPVNLSLSNIDVGATVSSLSLGALNSSISPTTTTTTTATGITLRGLTPGPQYLSVDGTLGATPVRGDAFDVAVTTGTAPVSASINATTFGTLLSTPSSSVTVSGSYQVGSRLTTKVSLQGTAAAFAEQPGTRYRHYWLAGGYPTGANSFALIGTGASLTVPSNFASYDYVILISIVSSPGQKPAFLQGIGYISPRLLAAFGGSSTIYPTGAVVAGTTPFPSALPAITGTARTGRTLTATPGAWSQSPTGFTYQWKRNGKAIAGAKAKTYRPGAADVGKRLTVTVTPVKAGHTVSSLTTAPTAKVAKAKPKVTAKPAKKTVAKGKKAKVSVKVTAPGLVATGKVTVRFGKSKVTRSLKKGKVTVSSKKLSTRGKVKITVTYGGSGALATSKAKAVTITVR